MPDWLKELLIYLLVVVLSIGVYLAVSRHPEEDRKRRKKRNKEILNCRLSEKGGMTL
jgi:hypothetical protein